MTKPIVRLRLSAVATLVGIAALAAACSTASTPAAQSSPSPAGRLAPASSGVIAPPSSTVTLTETGSTLLYPLFNLWGPAYHQKYPNISLSTAGTGSGTGISQATAGTIDIGASDAYLSPAQMAAKPGLLDIPLAISAQMINYNLPGLNGNLKMSGKVLSEIYQGKVKTWNDPAIAKLNPGVTLPSTAITALHRTDSSGDTFLFTQYLSKSDPNGWGKTVSFGTSVSFPAIPNSASYEGNGGMVSGCKATPGCIAYIGISYKTQTQQANLGEAQLENASGNFELPTPTTIEAEASSFVAKTPANGAISLIFGPGAGGYPIINYEYGIVLSSQSSNTVAQAIRALLSWAISSSGGNAASFLDQVGFQPLPASVVAQSSTQIAKIQ